MRLAGLNLLREVGDRRVEGIVLGNLGVDELQGFWFSRPIPADNCLALLDGRGPRLSGLRSVSGNSA